MIPVGVELKMLIKGEAAALGQGRQVEGRSVCLAEHVRDMLTLDQKSGLSNLAEKHIPKSYTLSF